MSVSTHSPDHANACAEPGRRRRLIGAFASRVGQQVAAQHRLPGLGQTLDTDHEVHVQRPEHDDTAGHDADQCYPWTAIDAPPGHA